MNTETKTPTEDRLAVVFAPGLWPLRLDLDAMSWLVSKGIAKGLSRLEGIVGYASPRGRVDRPIENISSQNLPTQNRPIRVYRSLPPENVVRAECGILGAEWAVTGRVLRDKEGFETWLNLLDGQTGNLLWTDRVYSPPAKFLWRTVYLVRELVRGTGERIPDKFGIRDVFPTGSYESYVSFARAYGLRHQWRGDVATGIEIVRSASRAAALDYTFDDAAALMLEFGLALIQRLEHVDEAEAFRDAIVGNSEFEPAKRLRRAVHERHLALAEGAKQT